MSSKPGARATSLPGPGGWLGTARSFVLSAEPRARPSRRAIGADVALAAIAALASVIALLATIRHQLQGPVLVLHHGDVLLYPGTGAAPGIPLGGLMTIAGTTIPLAIRRVRPLTAFWIIFIAIMAGSGYVTAITFFAVIFGAYSAVVHSRFRGLALLSVPAAGVIATAALPNTTPPLPARFSALLILLLVATVGNATRLWRGRAGASQARLVSMQAEHEAATRQAIEEERARIAGELHDVVTHNVSVMIVQAGAARQVLAGSPDEAREALLAVESSGRAAMTELRHLLGLLAPAGEMAAAGGAGGDGASLRPQPGLRQLRPLIDRVAATGLPVELHVSGSSRELPPGLDLTGYRVVQEALTNVLKHAGRPPTTVRLDYRDDELVVEVADAGQPSPPEGPAAPQAPAPGAGRGLLGLRERMAVYGGDVQAGPRPGGGWLVRARMPVDPVTAAGRS